MSHVLHIHVPCARWMCRKPRPADALERGRREPQSWLIAIQNRAKSRQSNDDGTQAHTASRGREPVYALSFSVRRIWKPANTSPFAPPDKEICDETFNHVTLVRGIFTPWTIQPQRAAAVSSVHIHTPSSCKAVVSYALCASYLVAVD